MWEAIAAVAAVGMVLWPMHRHMLNSEHRLTRIEDELAGLRRVVDHLFDVVPKRSSDKGE